MRSFFLFPLLFLFAMGCAQTSSKRITEVSQNEMNTVMLVDVRTPEEFAAGHLENAKNINLYDEDFAQQFKDVSKEETIYVYCKMGGRSAKAQEKLKSLGYHNVVNLEGGYDAYKLRQKE